MKNVPHAFILNRPNCHMTGKQIEIDGALCHYGDKGVILRGVSNVIQLYDVIIKQILYHC